VSLTDGDVAVLARQAADLVDPEWDVNIAPSDQADPYRWGSRSWLVHLDDAASVYLYEADEPAEALARLLDTLSNDVSETEQFWGVPFPACPGHRHPALIRVVGGEVVLHCPDTDNAVRRITPAVPR
jgi:hypothetical protein